MAAHDDPREPTPGAASLAYARALVGLRYVVVLAWIAAVVAAVLLLPPPGGGSLPLGGLVVTDAEAQRTAERSAELFRVPLVTDTAVIQRNPDGLSLAAQRRVAEEALGVTREDAGGDEILLALPVTNALGVVPGSREAGTASLTYLFFNPDASLHDRTVLANRFARALEESEPDAYAGATGPAPARYEAFQLIENWLPIVEAATVLAIALVVGVALRSLGAPLLTLLAAGGAYVVASRASAALGEWIGTAPPEEVQPVIVALALGLTTDYAVFYLAAGRRRLAQGSPREAVVDAAAGVTPVVVTAGLIVAAGTVVLVVADLDLFRVIGVVLAVTAIASLVTAITVVPGALAIVGHRLFWPGLREGADADERISPLREAAARFVVSRPVSLLVLVACLAALGFGAARAPDAKLGVRVIEGLPADAPPRRAASEAARAFAPGILAPTVVLVDSPDIEDEEAALARLQANLEDHPGVAAVIGPNDVPEELGAELFVSRFGNAARFALILEDDPLGASAIETVRSLDDRLPRLVADAGLGPASASMTGQTEIARQTVDAITDAIPLVAAAALAVNFLVLAVFLRALVAPLYLLAASALSIAATLGLTVLVFQELLGHGDVTYYVPFAAGVLLLALGSDYNVFLVGRIWQQTGTLRLREAIAVAAPRASKAITIAGLALALSFGALAIVPLGAMREFAFLMGVGVVVETFLVRPLLVPALVSLFGRTSAWPGRIERLEGRAPRT